MKTLLITFAFTLIGLSTFAQNDSITKQDSNTYRILKTDGTDHIGRILSQDDREILLLTSDNRKLYIPQHVIKEIILLDTKDFNSSGDFIGEDKFSTRYFLTTNGLPIKKGEHYVQWNLFGPDFQFGLGKNVGIGIMTTWVGAPIIANIKKSFKLGENINFGVGALLGTGSWGSPSWAGVLPFGTLTFGNRTKNITFSGGYGAVGQIGNMEGRAITSVAGMLKISPKLSLVFDSFILMGTRGEDITEPSGYTHNTGSDPVGLIIPGIRWHQTEGKAIQFGFTGIFTGDSFLPIPIPMVQWYRSL